MRRWAWCGKRGNDANRCADGGVLPHGPFYQTPRILPMPYGIFRHFRTDRSGHAKSDGSKRAQEVGNGDLDVSKHELGNVYSDTISPEDNLHAGSPAASSSCSAVASTPNGVCASAPLARHPSSHGGSLVVSQSLPPPPNYEGKVGAPFVRGADSAWAQANADGRARVISMSELGPSTKWRLLGSGEFCSAFSAVLDGREVVVKMLKPEQKNNPTAAADLQSETYLMISMR